MRNTLRLLVLALVAGPALTPAQKKDDILEIQRDVADLAEKVKSLQKSQDDKMEALRLLVQQAVTASNQVTQDMAALQRNLTNALTTSLATSANDQQNKISGAVGPLAAQMDAVAKSMEAITQAVTQMNGRVGALDTKLKDISDKVSILNQPAPSPPAALVVPDPNGAPPGVSRLVLWQDAENDFAGGNDETAVKEYSDFIKYFKDDTYAPTAGYRIGMVYLRQKDYDGAVQAFQDVIDHYAGNNKAQDALYQKAMALELGAHKKEAIAAFNEFLTSYPTNDYATQAHKELNKLLAPAVKPNNLKSKSGTK